MPTEEDSVVERSRGWWIPPEIVELVQEKKISPSELVLLSTINAYVSKDRGCFLSNGRLEELTGISERSVSRMISSMIEMGLIVQVWFDGKRRYLETCYSRIDMSKVKIPTHHKVEVLDSEESTSLANLARQDCQFGEAASPNWRGDLSVKESSKKRVEHPPSSNGFNLFDEGQKEKTYPRKCAELLHKHLVEKRKLMRPPSLSSWTETFRHFLMSSEVEKARFEKVLNWYAIHIGEKFIPLACSAQSFCDKFVQIEHQMEMQSEEEPPTNGYVEHKPNVVGTMTPQEAKEFLQKMEQDS